MDRYLVKKTSSSSADSGETSGSTPGTSASSATEGKKKKKPVGNESTVNSWKLNWTGLGPKEVVREIYEYTV